MKAYQLILSLILFFIGVTYISGEVMKVIKPIKITENYTKIRIDTNADGRDPHIMWSNIDEMNKYRYDVNPRTDIFTAYDDTFDEIKTKYKNLPLCNTKYEKNIDGEFYASRDINSTSEIIVPYINYYENALRYFMNNYPKDLYAPNSKMKILLREYIEKILGDLFLYECRQPEYEKSLSLTFKNSINKIFDALFDFFCYLNLHSDVPKNFLMQDLIDDIVRITDIPHIFNSGCKFYFRRLHKIIKQMYELKEDSKYFNCKTGRFLTRLLVFDFGCHEIKWVKKKQSPDIGGKNVTSME